MSPNNWQKYFLNILFSLIKVWKFKENVIVDWKSTVWVFNNNWTNAIRSLLRTIFLKMKCVVQIVQIVVLIPYSPIVLEVNIEKLLMDNIDTLNATSWTKVSCISLTLYNSIVFLFGLFHTRRFCYIWVKLHMRSVVKEIILKNVIKLSCHEDNII